MYNRKLSSENGVAMVEVAILAVAFIVALTVIFKLFGKIQKGDDEAVFITAVQSAGIQQGYTRGIEGLLKPLSATDRNAGTNNIYNHIKTYLPDHDPCVATFEVNTAGAVAGPVYSVGNCVCDFSGYYDMIAATATIEDGVTTATVDIAVMQASADSDSACNIFKTYRRGTEDVIPPALSNITAY